MGAELAIPKGDRGECAVHRRRRPHGLTVDFVGCIVLGDFPPFPTDTEADSAITQSLLHTGLEAGSSVVATGTTVGAQPRRVSCLGAQRGLMEEHATELDLLQRQRIVGVLRNGDIVLWVGHPQLMIPLLADGIENGRQQEVILGHRFRVDRLDWIAGRKGKHHDQANGHEAGCWGTILKRHRAELWDCMQSSPDPCPPD